MFGAEVADIAIGYLIALARDTFGLIEKLGREIGLNRQEFHCQ